MLTRNLLSNPKSRVCTGIVATLLLVASCRGAPGTADGRTAPLLDGMGDHHHAITTSDSLAQRYFDQGLVLAYAFNHAEAARSFREAVRRDTACAMCYWGIALVQGPNINATMDPADVPEAYSAMRSASRLASSVTPGERALIEAMATRYVEPAPDDRAALDRTYADAMAAVYERFPNDGDAAALYAEALMITTPWDYWTASGEPKPETERVLATLEAVLERHPDNPGANHFYIHVVEARRPELGVTAADRLRTLVPGAGHLVHMPAHIYLRVGRYHDASLANERAIEADRAYTEQSEVQGLYPLAYMPHNYHFLWAAATLEGRSAVAIEAAFEVAARQDGAAMREPGMGTLQHYWITPLFALVRFGQWDRILEEPQPADDLVYPTGVWHYARGMAYLRTGRPDVARRELEALERARRDPALDAVTIWDLNGTNRLLAIAARVLAGEIAAAEGLHDRAITQLEDAVRLESGLTYDEPPPWHFPVRQALGAVLLSADRAAEAERVYREDLAVFPENGWSLYGLAESLRAQGRTSEAGDVERRFAGAWRHADVTLTASRF